MLAADKQTANKQNEQPACVASSFAGYALACVSPQNTQPRSKYEKDDCQTDPGGSRVAGRFRCNLSSGRWRRIAAAVQAREPSVSRKVKAKTLWGPVLHWPPTCPWKR